MIFRTKAAHRPEINYKSRLLLLFRNRLQKLAHLPRIEYIHLNFQTNDDRSTRIRPNRYVQDFYREKKTPPKTKYNQYFSAIFGRSFIFIARFHTKIRISKLFPDIYAFVKFLSPKRIKLKSQTFSIHRNVSTRFFFSSVFCEMFLCDSMGKLIHLLNNFYSTNDTSVNNVLFLDSKKLPIEHLYKAAHNVSFTQ